MKMKMRLPARYYCRYPYEAPRGTVDTVEEIDLDRTAFLVVDVYGLGHHPGSPIPEMPPLFLTELHRLQGEIIRDRIRPTLDIAREHGLPVVYTENMWRRSAWDQSEFGRLVERTESGNAGSFDSIYVNEEYNRYSALIEPKPTDFVVQKTMYDSFFETTLDTVLRNLNAKYLVCAGFAADICLLNTVIGAMYRNYRVFVLRDCVLGSEFADTLADRSMTRWAIRYYEAMVGFTSSSEQFNAALRSAGR
jgi:nicotinamidase-related amidase